MGFFLSLKAYHLFNQAQQVLGKEVYALNPKIKFALDLIMSHFSNENINALALSILDSAGKNETKLKVEEEILLEQPAVSLNSMMTVIEEYDQGYDEDLQRAIQLSLQSAQENQNPSNGKEEESYVRRRFN